MRTYGIRPVPIPDEIACDWLVNDASDFYAKSDYVQVPAFSHGTKAVSVEEERALQQSLQR